MTALRPGHRPFVPRTVSPGWILSVLAAAGLVAAMLFAPAAKADPAPDAPSCLMTCEALTPPNPAQAARIETTPITPPHLGSGSNDRYVSAAAPVGPVRWERRTAAAPPAASSAPNGPSRPVTEKGPGPASTWHGSATTKRQELQVDNPTVAVRYLGRAEP